MRHWIKNHIPTQRRLVQLYTALLYNAHVKGFISGNIYTGSLKGICVPGLNCYSCPGAVGACPLGALQNAVSSSGNKAPYYILGILLLYGLTFGRTICGFLCPVGLMQELLHKIPTVKIKKSYITRLLSFLKYFILVIFVILIPFGFSRHSIPVPAFCKYICPEGTFGGAICLLSNPANADIFSMLGLLFTRKFVILLIIVAFCIFLFRAFCRFICPLGAIYSLFAKFNFVGVKVNSSKCIDCGKCVAVCEMDIRHVGDHECIHCGSCINACPTDAISFKAGKITLHAFDTGAISTPKEHEKKVRGICWAVALFLLAVVLFVCN